MSDSADAAVERGACLLGGRVRMAARDDDAALVQQVDQLERSGKLGSKRDVPDRPCRKQPLEQRSVRIAPRGRGMGTDPPGPRRLR